LISEKFKPNIELICFDTGRLIIEKTRLISEFRAVAEVIALCSE
jgi:hypothetical protein